jgi:opacity protein-like surface antigen
MIRRHRRPARALALALAAAAAAAAATAAVAAAEAQGEWRFAVAPFTYHWRYNAEHKPVWALGVERQRADGMLGGISFFSNSFGQDSSYYYIGQRHTGLGGRPQAYFLWSAGVLYGYRGQYEDKVPLNRHGFAPGALVALGWMLDRDASAQVNVLGDAGVMLQLNYAFR